MNIDYLYAAMIVKDLAKAEAFYAKVLGRKPDDRPMDTLVQWRGFGNAGIQLFTGSGTPGGGRMTLVVADVAALGVELAAQGITLGQVRQGDYGKIAQLSDPDGNLITFAEPPAPAPAAS